MSNIKYQISNIKYQILNIKYQISNIKPSQISKETSMLKSPYTRDFLNNRKETSMLNSPRTLDSKTSKCSRSPEIVAQFCFPLISFVKSYLALCMFALQNQLY